MSDGARLERRMARRGRGAISNRSGRFEVHSREAFDDGWGTVEDDLPRLETDVAWDSSRSVIVRNDSPDISFDRSINPYRGCEHGCIYCFARPTHAWLGLSPGQDFETRLFAKPEADRLLRRELSRPGYRPRPIALGTATDVYQPVERRLGITRRILEVLWQCRHPVGIVTKSALVVRDADILGEMAGARLARVSISIATLRRDLARRMDPRAPTPARRLAAMEALARAGVPVGAMFAPVIPGLNDGEMEAVLQAARDAGAVTAAWSMLRLPLEVKELFWEWLDNHYGARAARVRALLRNCRNGRDYDPRWGRRMKGEGPIAEMTAKRFALAVRRLGLPGWGQPLDCSRFVKPPRQEGQLALL